MDVIAQITIEIIASVEKLALGAVLAFISYLVFILPRYRRLLTFFGMKRGRRRLRIYLSHLNIPQWTALTADGTKTGSFFGPAIAAAEFEIIPWLSRLFLTVGPVQLPQPLKRLMSKFHLFSEPEIIFSLSPPQEKDLVFDNMICIGSETYNVATAYYHKRELSYLRFEQENQEVFVTITRGKRKGEKFPAFMEEQGIRRECDLAILQKVVDDENNNTVIIAAGLGVNGTRGALKYLVDNWAELERRYPNQEFAWCLRYPTVLEDRRGYLKAPIVILRLPS